jgi:hypothetical protein
LHLRALPRHRAKREDGEEKEIESAITKHSLSREGAAACLSNRVNG